MSEVTLPTPEPLTDVDKIAWLWQARDRDNERIASLEFELQKVKVERDRARAENDGLRARLFTASEERDAMALELNAARISAANAVQEYRSSVER